MQNIDEEEMDEKIKNKIIDLNQFAVNMLQETIGYVAGNCWI